MTRQTNLVLTHEAANLLLNGLLKSVVPDSNVKLRVRQTKTDKGRTKNMVGKDDPLIQQLNQVIEGKYSE